MIEDKIKLKTTDAIKSLYGQNVDPEQIQLEKTNREHKGDFTLVVFPLLRYSKKSPQDTAMEIGDFLLDSLVEIDACEVIKGFLNLTLSKKFWVDFFLTHINDDLYGFKTTKEKVPFVVEYSSPNTNKPLQRCFL